MKKSKLTQEWEIARDDLELSIVAPFKVEVGGGKAVHADVLVRNFGGRLGTLVFATADAVAPYGDALFDEGFGISVLHEPDDVKYDRDSLVRMLNDWGWTGSESAKPDWIQD